jgi:isopentenyl diphosphate isomerase/L-lactate dehydrogenase-like FMN-dependent dehydrogenase
MIPSGKGFPPEARPSFRTIYITASDAKRRHGHLEAGYHRLWAGIDFDISRCVMNDNSLRANWPVPAPAPELRRPDRFESYESVQRLARKRLPRSLFSELANGAGRGITQRENMRAFDEITFRPRAAVFNDARDLRATVLGTPVSMPVLVDPIGGLRLFHPSGGPGVARAAEAAGTICAVSMAVGHSVSEMRAASRGPLWQQLYMIQGREAAERIMDEAQRAGYVALVVTVDTAIRTRRQSAMRINVQNILEFAPELLVRPRWTLGFLRDGMQLAVPNSVLAPSNATPRYTATWEDFAWIRQQWRGPLVVKGIVSADDARRSVDIGAQAIVVSNHGGITFDGSPATLRKLPEVLKAVPGNIEVFLDSGVRQGTDVVKAIALGARAVLIGRPYAMALAADGERGVRYVLEQFRYETDRTLGLLGCPSIAQLDRSYIETPG